MIPSFIEHTIFLYIKVEYNTVRQTLLHDGRPPTERNIKLSNTLYILDYDFDPAHVNI